MNASSPRRRSKTVKALALALGLAAGLLAAEALARLYCSRRPDRAPVLQQFHPFLGYSLKPSSSTTISDEFGTRRYSTNSLGLRGREVPRRKSPSTFRIICVGGSTTENAYVDDDETYPAQLERMLQKQYPDTNVEVLNAGLSAYSTAHTLINFQLNLVELEPDLLIVYQAVNDLMPMAYDNFWSDYRNFYKGYHLRRAVATDLRLDPQWPAWVLRTGLGQLAARARRGMMSWIGDELPERPDQFVHRLPPIILRVYDRNLRHLVELARAEGCEVCLATFAHTIRPGMSEEDMRRLRRFPWFHHLSPWGVSEAIDTMNGIVRGIHEDSHTLFVDHAALMPKSYEYFLDMCHKRAAGCRLMARHFADAIAADGVIARRRDAR